MDGNNGFFLFVGIVVFGIACGFNWHSIPVAFMVMGAGIIIAATFSGMLTYLNGKKE